MKGRIEAAHALGRPMKCVKQLLPALSPTLSVSDQFLILLPYTIYVLPCATRS